MWVLEKDAPGLQELRSHLRETEEGVTPEALFSGRSGKGGTGTCRHCWLGHTVNAPGSSGWHFSGDSGSSQEHNLTLLEALPEPGDVC